MYSAAQYLVKWAANEENRAIQDVSQHITELNQIWTEAQRDFVGEIFKFVTRQGATYIVWEFIQHILSNVSSNHFISRS